MNIRNGLCAVGAFHLSFDRISNNFAPAEPMDSQKSPFVSTAWRKAVDAFLQLMNSRRRLCLFRCTSLCGFGDRAALYLFHHICGYHL